MAPELYLITPPQPDLKNFPATLMAVLGAAEFSAILVARDTLNDADYAALATSIINIGQGADCAVLLEDDPVLARHLGADGVHITTGTKAISAAIAALKPDMIVGAGNLVSRHDAMNAGETGIDYIFFGPLAAPADPDAPDLAQWWADTFEVPAVLSLPDAHTGAIDARGAEFIALSSSIWSSSASADAVRSIATYLREHT